MTYFIGQVKFVITGITMNCSQTKESTKQSIFGQGGAQQKSRLEN